MLTDRDRRDLYAALIDRLGEGPADVLMELLPPVGWSDVARQSDIVATRGEISEVRGEISGLRAELVQTRAELAERIGKLEAKVDTLIPRMFMHEVALVLSTFGIAFGVAKLA